MRESWRARGCAVRSGKREAGSEIRYCDDVVQSVATDLARSGKMFEFWWVSLPDGVPELIAGHGDMLPALFEAMSLA